MRCAHGGHSGIRYHKNKYPELIAILLSTFPPLLATKDSILDAKMDGSRCVVDAYSIKHLGSPRLCWRTDSFLCPGREKRFECLRESPRSNVLLERIHTSVERLLPKIRTHQGW